MPYRKRKVLVGVASWLANLRDWLAEEISLADGESVSLRRTQAGGIREGLGRCIRTIDTLPVDAAHLPAPGTTSPTPFTLSTRALQ